MKLIPINHNKLQEGQLFKWTTRQRKFRTFKKRYLLKEESCPKEDIGKYLIVFDNSKMVALEPDQKVFVIIDYSA